LPRPTALIAILIACLLWSGPAHAYIGPGAGFAFAGSLLVLLTTFFLAAGTILFWPILYLWRLIRVGNPLKKARARRVVVLGLDGLDPGIAFKLMAQGRMPNFRKLAEKGVFRPLATTNPSMSPVAWSSFTTGVDPSRHAIYDFLTRDPRNYMPLLSSTDIGNPKRVLMVGDYKIPLEKPRIKLLQRSQAFWKLLGEKHIHSIIQRVPITFPAIEFNGLLLSAMCVPDLRGSQGTFSFFSTASQDGQAAFTGGEQTVLRRKGDRIRSRIVGPDNSMSKQGGRMTLPFTIIVADDKRSARLEIDDCDPFSLRVDEYSPWIKLVFKPGLGIKVHGIARFRFTSLDPDVNLYMTAIHIDPEDPAMPISHPTTYAMYLARRQGSFATLGLAEDTWALNERVIDEQAFWDQAWLYYDERERMFLDALKQCRTGVVTTVFDTTDRIQHMFMRYLDPSHPANEGKDVERFKDAIFELYERMDGLLGKLDHEIEREDTVFMVVSDHGFSNFRRGVNLNTWLFENGYLFLKDEAAKTSEDWFDGVDWSRTRAYSLGLTGLFINLKGREAEGIVQRGEEYQSLKAELIGKLQALEDPATGERCVIQAYDAMEHFSGPYRQEAPDVLLGWQGGYRHSWECATGSVTESVFSDNVKSWSGDHCVDPSVVPGVLFCNRPIATDTPRLMDIPASILQLFGQPLPRQMQGRPIFPADGQQAAVKGMLDPSTLVQSGAAPGALLSPEERDAS